MADQEETLEELQCEWKTMYQDLLPEAARTKSPSQPTWPVTLDHCFARIILDAIVGMDAPWTTRIKSPAYKHMSKPLLRWSIELGRRILEGEEDLVELDNMSLELRGKSKMVERKAVAKVDGTKRKREAEQDVANKDDMKRKREREEADQNPTVTNKDIKSTHASSPPPTPSPNERSPYFTITTTTRTPEPSTKNEDLTPYFKKIALSHKTPFQKKVLTLLCQIPRGKFTTYAAISKHLSSSPRAIGNAIRNNPFAPHVPCHRVLASGGGIGGFHGSWGRNGEKGLNDDKKRKMLREEGVRFDGKGMAIGSVWEGF